MDFLYVFIYVYLFFFWGNKGNTLEPQGINGVTKGVTVTLKIGNKKKKVKNLLFIQTL